MVDFKVISLFLFTLLLFSSTLSHAQTKQGMVTQRCTDASSCGFDPALSSGTPGLPGIRGRLNPRLFRYASQLAGETINREIRKSLPKSIQSTLPLLDGQFVLNDAHIARYRCPQRVVLITKSPNQMLLQVQNFDVGINANTGGNVTTGIPMVPSRSVKIDVRGLTVNVEISVEKSDEGLRASIVSCSNYINHVEISVEGWDDAKTLPLLKRFVSKFIRNFLPAELCKIITQGVNQHILTEFNTRLASIPKAVSLSSIGKLVGLNLFSAKPDPAFCERECGAMKASNASVSSQIENLLSQTNKNIHPLCMQCAASSDNSTSMFQGLMEGINLRKIGDFFVSMKLLNSYANDDGFIMDLRGELSPRGEGGTPFGPFPLFFPTLIHDRMVDAIFSDYTVNTLLYWAYKKGAIAIRVGPDTPKIGDLLKMTCFNEDMDYGEAQLDEEETRAKRQAFGEDALSGFCLGDVMPALREKYPKKQATVDVRATRAPSILFSAKRGGSALIDIQAEAGLFLEGITKKIGTLKAAIRIDIAVHIKGKKLFGKGKLTVFKFSDSTRSLGISQETLDNLGQLGKGMIEKQANDALAKGVPIRMVQPPTQPSTFYNAQMNIIDHGLHVAADLTIASALLETLAHSGSCYQF